MNTLQLTQLDIALAADILKSGGLVGIPTETVYGLGANGLDPDAVARIFEAKGRPQDNPLILHIPSADWLERYCENIPQDAYILADQFWPGPLTMILKRKDVVPDVVTAGLDTVGMRCPDHAVCRAIIDRADIPVAAPSGNRSGRPSPTTAHHMMTDMDGKIDAIVDGGACTVGVESTIVDLTGEVPRLLRPGGITLEQLEQVLGKVEVDAAVRRLMGEGEQPRAPGMKYRHYAPKAPVTVVKGSPEETAQYIASHVQAGCGVICFDEYADRFTGYTIKTLGRSDDSAEQARHVFDALRFFDDTDVTEIWAQCPDEHGVGLAVANRLNKAAGFHIVNAGIKVIGITGPTGAGKTTALHALEELGGHVVDCDAVYHDLLIHCQPMREELRARYGPHVFTAEGILDRKALGAIVFDDSKALEDLNNITHKYVGAAVEKAIERACQEGIPAIAIDAIALIESGISDRCHCTVAVTAPNEVRIQRIMAREGISEEYARLRVDAQKKEEWFQEHCTYVLVNDCPTAELFQARARALFEQVINQQEELT